MLPSAGPTLRPRWPARLGACSRLLRTKCAVSGLVRRRRGGRRACPALPRNLAAMSDDDDASDVSPVAVPEVSPAVPEVSKGWSEQDRRTLIITIGGTLAANLATVILVAAAVGIVHSFNNPGTKAGLKSLGVGIRVTPSLAALATTVASVLSIAYGSAVVRGRDPLARLLRGQPASKTAGKWFIWAGSLAALEAMLILTGLAAGVK
jgi:hypothetical protein